MRVSGTARIPAPRAEVWRRLRDPAVLGAAVPGCRSLERRGAGVWAVTATTGLAGTHGTYGAQVRVVEVDGPSRCRVAVDAAGSAGSLRADVLVELEETGDDTLVRYEVDAVVDGRLARVGRGVLVGAATRVADDLAAGLAQPIGALASDAVVVSVRASDADARPISAAEAAAESAAAAAFASAEAGAPASAGDASDPARRRRLAASATIGAVLTAAAGVVLRRRGEGSGRRRGGR